FRVGPRVNGQYIANTSLFIMVVSSLATLDVKEALDEDGREIELSYEFDSGFINAPLPFKCSIHPRSKQATALIQ
ncbi:hypothetical protein B0H13DRAFT_1556037, partial [Mycena leptocephala]